MDKFIESVCNVLAAAFIAVAVIGLAGLISAFPVKWAWNATMPELFHLPEIGVLKAFCLVWLAGAFIKAAPEKSGGK